MLSMPGGMGPAQLSAGILLAVRPTDVPVVLQQTYQLTPYIRQRPSGDANHHVPRRLLKPKKTNWVAISVQNEVQGFWGLYNLASVVYSTNNGVPDG